jgi:hypothetical protein
VKRSRPDEVAVGSTRIAIGGYSDGATRGGRAVPGAGWRYGLSGFVRLKANSPSSKKAALILPPWS